MVEEIKKLEFPQIFLWYIGISGLKQGGVDFYRDFIISPLMEAQNHSAFWLVDLTAWGALRRSQNSITQFSSLCENIDGFSINGIKVVKTSDIFARMKNITDPIVLKYFRRAMKRAFIKASSEDVPLTNITIRSIFGDDCPILEDLYDCDASRCYSILQYLEACLLIEKIVLQSAQKEIQIVFALPNDEIKYYKDREGSFQKDVEFLINQALCCDGLIINVKFLCFRYGDNKSHRPYNAPGNVLKKNRLKRNNITNQ